MKKSTIKQLTDALEEARVILDFDLAHCRPTSASADAEMERQTYRHAIANIDAALIAAKAEGAA